MTLKRERRADDDARGKKRKNKSFSIPENAELLKKLEKGMPVIYMVKGLVRLFLYEVIVGGDLCHPALYVIW